MKKILLVLVLLCCFGCEGKEENEFILPVISNIELSSVEKTYIHAVDGIIQDEALEYKFTLEPYNLLVNEDSNVCIGVAIESQHLNAYFEPAIGLKNFNEVVFISETIPSKSDEPIVVCVYKRFPYEVETVTLDLIEGYIPSIKEVNYEIHVDEKVIYSDKFLIE